MESHEDEQHTTDAPALAEGMAGQERGKRAAKATVFEDIFSDPAYRLQLVQALHPEMKDLAQGDIALLTLINVLLDGPYNDLGLFVRGKLVRYRGHERHEDPPGPAGDLHQEAVIELQGAGACVSPFPYVIILGERAGSRAAPLLRKGS